MPLRKKIINSVLGTLDLDTLSGSKCEIEAAREPAEGQDVDLEFGRQLGDLIVDLREIYKRVVDMAERQQACYVDSIPSKGD